MKTGANRYLRLMRTIGITGVAFVINYLISLFLTPHITDNVGTEAFGFVTLAKNIAQYATIATLALNSYAARHIAVEYHRGDIEKANIYFSSTVFGDAVLGLVVFAAAAVGIVYLDRIFTIPQEIVPDVRLLFLLVFIKFLAVTVFTAAESGAAIADRLDTAGVFKLISYITEAAVLLVVYRVFAARVYFVGIGLLAASLVIIAGNVFICRKYTPELKVSRKSYRFSAVRRLIGDGIWTTVNDLGAMLHSGLDLVMCNLMLTPLCMGQLSIAKDIDLIFHSLYQLVGNAFHPMLLKSYADGDKDKLLSQLKLSMKLSGCLSNLAFAGFAALGTAYFTLWIPSQDTDLIYRLTLITVLTSVASGPMTPLYYIYTLTVKQKFPCIVTIVTGLMNVLGMYLLIRFTTLGVWAVVWTTVVLVGFINYVSNPLYMAHVLNVPKGTFYPGIVRNVLSCGAMTLLFYGLSRLYMPDSWITLFLCAGIYALLGSCIHFTVCLSRQERGQLLAKLRKRHGTENAL